MNQPFMPPGALPAHSTKLSGRTPPVFVPTLTEVVSAATVQLPKKVLPEIPESAQLDAFENLIVRRVMQRVDLVLERRLREVVGQVILTHTQALSAHLLEEIEQVVSASVVQAVAQELQSKQE